MAKYQYIYFMDDLSKQYTGGKKILENIHLQFFPDAKIGIVGVNGAGKSTLLRIMAGVETEFNGEAWAAEGASVGLLEQEPQLDPAKTVEGNVLEGLAEQTALVSRFEAVSAKLGEVTDPDEMTALIEDDVVDLFCAKGTHDTIAAAIDERFGGLVDTVSLDAGTPASVVAEVRSIGP